MEKTHCLKYIETNLKRLHHYKFNMTSVWLPFVYVCDVTSLTYAAQLARLGLYLLNEEKGHTL